MKHIKQWHRVAVVAVLLSLMCSVSVGAYDFKANNIYYNINDKTLTAEVTFASNSYNSYSGQVVIPATVSNSGKTYDVTAVGENAFRDCSGLTGVTFGSNVSTIGKRAFLNCSALTTVTITEGVTEIDDYAFAQCSALQLVIMDNDAPLQVGNGAFMSCSSLQDVRWQSCENLEGRGGLASLGTKAFAYCTSLPGIMLPGNLEHLGTSIFEGCTVFTFIIVTAEQPLALSGDPFALIRSVGISVPSSGQAGVTADRYRNAVGWNKYVINESPYTFKDFYGCTYLKTSSSTVALTGMLIPYPEVNVRNSLTGYGGEVYYVTSIGDQAFKGAEITSINTNNALRLKEIGTESFANCANLTNVSLIEGINVMGERAFASCTALQTIKLPSTLRTISKGAFDGCTSLNDVKLQLGASVLSENAFAHCTSLTTLSLPRSITSVEDNVLNGASALTEILVDPNCPYYASIEGVLYELNYSEGLDPYDAAKFRKLVVYPPRKVGEMLYIPPGVTEIRPAAIQNALYLKKIAIPPTTTTFGDNCFNGTGIQYINYRCPTPSNEGTNGITAALKSNATLQVPVGTAGDYQSLSAWQGFKAIVERYDVHDDDQFVYDWNSHDQVTLVDIKPAAVDASGIVTLPLGMTLNGRDYFISELRNTSTAQVAQQIKRLKINCDSLAIIDLSDDINPLSALSALEVISLTPANPFFKLEDNVLYDYRGRKVYYYLRSNPQESFTLPATVDSIMPQAFANNKNIKVLISNSSLKCFGNKAFENCTSLQLVDKINYVAHISDRAFAGCTALTTINGGEKLNRIGNEAFLNCSNLKQFPFCHGMVVDVGNHAFKGCSSLTVVVFAFTLKTIGDGAFEDCTSLNKVFFTTDIENMGQRLFKGCAALSEVWLNNATPQQVGNDFFDTSASFTLYVPQSAVGAYSTTAPWNRASQVKTCHFLDNGPDVNNDKLVNAFDVTLIYSVLLGGTDNEFVNNCDVNHDGAVTAADISIIYNYILYESTVLMPYWFIGNNSNPIEQFISMTDEHQKIRAIENDTENFVTSGFMVVTDHPQVANLTYGTSQGVPYFELVPVAPGYFTLVAIVDNGTGNYYRTFPLVVQ